MVSHSQKVIRFLANQLLLREMVKFAIVGLVGTAVDMGLLNLIHLKLGTSLYWAVFWGFAVATITVYVLNNHWTYRRLGLPFQTQTLSKYTVVAAVGLAITEGIIHLLAVENGLYYNLAKVIAIVIVFFWNFFGNRYWTFRAKP